jgi:hypothetical protein
MAGCTKCTGPAFCNQCHTDTYYQLSGGTRCFLCSNNPSLPNCHICLYTGAACTVCQPNFMLSPILNQCATCSSVVPNCVTCVTNACNSCDPGFALSNSTCISCQNLIPNCGFCNATTCISCLTGFYSNSSTCGPCSVITNCTDCTNSTMCTTCVANSTIVSSGFMNLCQLCSQLMDGCLTCTIFNACALCDSANGYYLNSSQFC